MSKAVCSCSIHERSQKKNSWRGFHPSKHELKKFIFEVDDDIDEHHQSNIFDLDFCPDPFISVTVSEIDFTAEEAMDR